LEETNAVRPMERHELVQLLARLADRCDDLGPYDRLVDLYDRWLYADKYRVIGAAILWSAWGGKLIDHYFSCAGRKEE
jgi:hypothetical protein